MTRAKLAIYASGKFKGEMEVTLINWIPELNFKINAKLRALLWEELQRKLMIKRLSDISNTDTVSFMWTIPSKMNHPDFIEDEEREEPIDNFILLHEQSLS